MSINELRELNDKKEMQHWIAKVIAILAIMLSIFQLYVSLFSKLGVMQERAIFLGLGLVLTFLIYPTRKGWEGTKKEWIIKSIFIVGAVTSTIYIVNKFDTIVSSFGFPSVLDLTFGVIAIIVIFESARRAIGLGLPIIALAGVAYIFLGPYLPELINHYGITFERFVSSMYMTTQGIFGSILGVVATYVFMFILFGAFLNQSGAGKFYIQLSLALVGKLRGGPAYVATLASALMGTVNGSGVANAASTGVFTIPMMKGAKFKPNFAAAVEALASSGGQILPPVMGAAAFIMVDFTGETYVTIMSAALIPALLYFISIFFMIYFETKKLNIEPVQDVDIPKLKPLLLKNFHHFLPPIFLVLLMTAAKLTPVYSAVITIGLIVVTSWIRKESRMTPRKILRALEEGAKGSVMIIGVAALASILIGVINLTGIGLEMSSWIITLAGGSLIALLILTMISSLILGMGLPTSACYIILAVLVAPALIDMGLNPIGAHMFVLYFGVLAIVTPPIGGAIYVTSSIAKSNVNYTGLIATKLGIAGFLVPFIFVRNDAMLMMAPAGDIIIAFITSMIGVFSLAAGVQGYLLYKTNILSRLVLIGGALLMIEPGILTDILGIGLFVSVLIYQWIMRKGGSKKILDNEFVNKADSM